MDLSKELLTAREVKPVRARAHAAAHQCGTAGELAGLVARCMMLARARTRTLGKEE